MNKVNQVSPTNNMIIVDLVEVATADHWFPCDLAECLVAQSTRGQKMMVMMTLTTDRYQLHDSRTSFLAHVDLTGGLATVAAAGDTVPR